MTVRRRPNLLWRLFVILGIGTMTAVTVSDEAWEAWKEQFGESLPRDTIRATLAGTAVVHVVEGGAAWSSARRAGLEHPARWGLSTVIWGFPVLFRLRKAKRAAA